MWMRANSLLTQTFSISSVDAILEENGSAAPRFGTVFHNLRRTPAAGEYNLPCVSFPEAKVFVVFVVVVVVVALRSWPLAAEHADFSMQETSKTDSFVREIERLATLAMLHSCYHLKS